LHVDFPFYDLLLSDKRLTVCVSGLWAGRDSLREQKKLDTRKMLENRAESHKSTARFVRRCFVLQDLALLEDVMT
jgi:lipopolysaccharide biosynthesis protein